MKSLSTYYKHNSQKKTSIIKYPYSEGKKISPLNEDASESDHLNPNIPSLDSFVVMVIVIGKGGQAWSVWQLHHRALSHAPAEGQPPRNCCVPFPFV